MSLPLWACGAAGSALPWHGRGHRFDPDQVHQSFQSFRSTSLPRPCRILVPNSKTTPLTGFASGISCAEAAFRSFAGLPFFVVTLEFAPADRVFGDAAFGSRRAGPVVSVPVSSEWIELIAVRTSSSNDCI